MLSVLRILDIVEELWDLGRSVKLLRRSWSPSRWDGGVRREDVKEVIVRVICNNNSVPVRQRHRGRQLEFRQISSDFNVEHSNNRIIFGYNVRGVSWFEVFEVASETSACHEVGQSNYWKE